MACASLGLVKTEGGHEQAEEQPSLPAWLWASSSGQSSRVRGNPDGSQTIYLGKLNVRHVCATKLDRGRTPTSSTGSASPEDGSFEHYPGHLDKVIGTTSPKEKTFTC